MVPANIHLITYKVKIFNVVKKTGWFLFDCVNVHTMRTGKYSGPMLTGQYAGTM